MSIHAAVCQMRGAMQVLKAERCQRTLSCLPLRLCTEIYRGDRLTFGVHAPARCPHVMRLLQYQLHLIQLHSQRGVNQDQLIYSCTEHGCGHRLVTGAHAPISIIRDAAAVIPASSHVAPYQGELSALTRGSGPDAKVITQLHRQPTVRVFFLCCMLMCSHRETRIVDAQVITFIAAIPWEAMHNLQ